MPHQRVQIAMKSFRHIFFNKNAHVLVENGYIGLRVNLCINPIVLHIKNDYIYAYIYIYI